MNIRVSKLYQGAPWGSLEVAFNSDPEGDRMMSEIVRVTGLRFTRPPANLFAMRELHIAEVGGEEALESAFAAAFEIALRYGDVQDSQKNMKGPGEVSTNELSRALADQQTALPGSQNGS
jgi:hypothetical protein